MASGLDLNFLGMSTQSLLIVLIVIMLIQSFMLLSCGGEGFASNVDYDKYQAAYNQEQDNMLGATPSGDALNKKVVSAWDTKPEGLVGSYGEQPAFWDGHLYNMEQKKSAGGVITTTRGIDTVETFTEGNNSDDMLTKILHGEA